MVFWFLILKSFWVLKKKCSSHGLYLFSLMSPNCSFIRASKCAKNCIRFFWAYWIFLLHCYLTTGNLNCMVEINLGNHYLLMLFTFKDITQKCEVSFELSKIWLPNPLSLEILEPKDLSQHQMQSPSSCWNSSVPPSLAPLFQETSCSELPTAQDNALRPDLCGDFHPWFCP